MQARKRDLFNCFSISYSKDCELIVQFNVKFTFRSLPGDSILTLRRLLSAMFLPTT